VAAFSDGESAYLAALERIDAGLVVNEERALRRARETCDDIAAGELSEAKLVERVVFRLSGGNATIDAKQATQAVALMKQHIC